VIACAARKCGVERNLCTPSSLFAADGRQFLARFTFARLTCRFGNLLAPPFGVVLGVVLGAAGRGG